MVLESPGSSRKGLFSPAKEAFLLSGYESCGNADADWPKRALTRSPVCPFSRIGQFMPYRRILAAPPWPSWEAQVQTEHPDKDEGEKRESEEREHEDRGHLAAPA